MYRLELVRTEKDWDAFIGLPWHIYKRDLYWIPPLRVAVKELLNIKKNPFFKHAQMRPVIAMKDSRCLGRIVGIIDNNHNQFHSEKTAFFGFFESVLDYDLAKLLLDDVANWARAHGMSTLRGPMSLSTNNECGLLIEGYDDSPAVMMPYNPPYYEKLIEKCGFVKAKDLFAYSINSEANETKILTELIADAERVRVDNNINFRSIDMNKFEQEVDTIFAICNDASENNCGFVPVNREEFHHLATEMRAIIDPGLFLMIEVKGQTAGFALALPDVNPILRKIKDGKLFPFGLFKLLWYLKGSGRRSVLYRTRIITLGVRKAYRLLRLVPLLYAEYMKRGPKLGYRIGEVSWISEDNNAMNLDLQDLGAEKTKVYRIYDCAL